MSKQNQDTRPVYMGTYDRDMKIKNVQISGLKNDVATLSKAFIKNDEKNIKFEENLLVTNVISISAIGLSVIAILMQIF
jgi:hypothetical protein